MGNTAIGTNQCLPPAITSTQQAPAGGIYDDVAGICRPKPSTLSPLDLICRQPSGVSSQVQMSSKAQPPAPSQASGVSAVGRSRSHGNREIRRDQMNLNFLTVFDDELNNSRIATDGIQGPKTREAAKFYQDLRNQISQETPLEPTGRLDAATRQSLRADVRCAQTNLQTLGYDLGRHGADGIAGRNTQAALRQFQRDNGFPETGRLDTLTKALLEGMATQPDQGPGDFVVPGTPGYTDTRNIA